MNVACRRFDDFIAADDEPWLKGPTKYPLKLAAFWAVQSLWSFTVLLPVTVAQAYKPAASMGAWGWIGFALYMTFFAYEATGAQHTSCTVLPVVWSARLAQSQPVHAVNLLQPEASATSPPCSCCWHAPL